VTIPWPSVARRALQPPASDPRSTRPRASSCRRATTPCWRAASAATIASREFDRPRI